MADAPASPSQASAAPADLGALVMALQLLVTAFEVTTRSAPALALLGALRGLLALVARYQADPARCALAPVPMASPPPEAGALPFAGLALVSLGTSGGAAEASPSPPPRAPEAPDVAPPLHPTHRALVLSTIEAFRWCSDAAESGYTLALELDQLAAFGADVSVACSHLEELRGRLFALGGVLGETSRHLTGEEAGACPATHVEGLTTLALLAMPDDEGASLARHWLRCAREAFEGRAA